MDQTAWWPKHMHHGTEKGCLCHKPLKYQKSFQFQPQRNMFPRLQATRPPHLVESI